MTERGDYNLRNILKRAMPPVTDAELKQDLWPRMLRRLDQDEVRVPWFDWALVALLAAGFLFYPQLIPVLLYCL